MIQALNGSRFQVRTETVVTTTYPAKALRLAPGSLLRSLLRREGACRAQIVPDAGPVSRRLEGGLDA